MYQCHIHLNGVKWYCQQHLLPLKPWLHHLSFCHQNMYHLVQDYRISETLCHNQWWYRSSVTSMLTVCPIHRFIHTKNDTENSQYTSINQALAEMLTMPSAHSPLKTPVKHKVKKHKKHQRHKETKSEVASSPNKPTNGMVFEKMDLKMKSSVSLL